MEGRKIVGPQNFPDSYHMSVWEGSIALVLWVWDLRWELCVDVGARCAYNEGRRRCYRCRVQHYRSEERGCFPKQWRVSEVGQRFLLHKEEWNVLDMGSEF